MKRTAIWAIGGAGLVAVSLLTAPRLARAHSAENHGAPYAQQEAPATAPRIADGRFGAVSAPCGGSHSGGVCTCGVPAACHGPKPAAFIAPGAAAHVAITGTAVAIAELPLARAPPRAFSLRFSRAPPNFS